VRRDVLNKALSAARAPLWQQASDLERFTAHGDFHCFATAWGGQYPAIIKLWRAAWSEFVPFLDYDVEIPRIICSTNAIESLNARYCRAVRARGHFPTEQAALKCLYLITRSLDPTGRGRAKRAVRWKPALNAFAITFEDRITPSTTN
jgi:putative transposase